MTLSSKEDASHHEAFSTTPKILRVPQNFGVQFKGMLGDTEMEQAYLDTFTKHGFLIEREGVFNSANPHEFGLERNHDVTQREKDSKIAAELSVSMPETFTPLEVLKSHEPCVAKIPDTNRGELKYLLETPEQKIRFITWCLIGNNFSEFLEEGISLREKINELLSKVENGNFEDFFFTQNSLGHWVFEEYIDTPGDYNTSLRVVVDGLGQIHYAQVARSDQPKNSPSKTSNEVTLKPLPADSADLWGTNLSIFIEHPDSPLYIAPKPFVSNIARGGKPLILNGEPVTEQTDRDILTSLGINPDNPQLPPCLYDVSSQMGKLSRKDYPFVGIDYLKRKTGNEWPMIEINTGPHLRPEALGLPAETDESTTDLYLLKKVLSSV